MTELKTHQDEHFSVLCNAWEKESGCPWPDCRSQKRSTVFQSKTAFKKHLRTHFKSHWCQHPGCTYDKPFGNERDVDRHRRSRHLLMRCFTCTFPSCSSSFARKDKLDLHTRKEHPSSYCGMDHCGRIVLNLDRDDHFNKFHNGRPLEGQRSFFRYEQDGIFECALPGCESTISRFNSTSVQRHLNTSHGLDYWLTRDMVNHLRNAEGCPETLTIRQKEIFTKSIRFRPCDICTKKIIDARAILPDTTVKNSV